MEPFRVIFMDAGQGDATLVVFPDNSLVLVDCGCKKNAGIVSGEISQVLNHFLPLAPGKKIKTLVLTHPDGDHYNLVQDLVLTPKTQVDHVIYSCHANMYTGLATMLPKPSLWDVHKKPYASASPDPALSYNDGTYAISGYVLAANVGCDSVASKTDKNQSSIVLLFQYKDVNVILTGDSTVATEKAILAEPSLKALIAGKRNVLKVGHHGSQTSTCAEWITAVSPELAIVSSDTKVFGSSSIPRKEVMDSLLNHNSIVDLPAYPPHTYVQYNATSLRHEAISTTKALFTTLYDLKFAPNNIDFEAHGTSWHYSIQMKPGKKVDNADLGIEASNGWPSKPPKKL